MFLKSSRYASCEDTQLVTRDGDIIKYKKRRFIPQTEDASTLQEIQVLSGDRLDLISAKITGDSQQFWRICDSNDVLNPQDLVSPGKIIRIASPW